MSRNGLIFTCFILAAVLISIPAIPVMLQAEPGPAEVFLGKVAEARLDLESLKAVYEFPAAPEEIDPAPGTGVQETVFFRAPDRIRLNLSWPDREEVFLAVNQKTLVMVGDQATDTPWPQPFLLFRLLVDSDRKRIRDLLVLFDIDLTRTWVSPDGKEMVIGDDQENGKRSQVRFEADTFRLTRLILSPRRDRAGFDIRLEDYARHEPGVDWPHQLVVSMDQGSDPIAPVVLKLKSFGVDPQVDLAAFDLEEIRRTVAPPPEPWTTTNPDLIEIRKMMEWVEKKLQ